MATSNKEAIEALRAGVNELLERMNAQQLCAVWIMAKNMLD